MMRHRGPLARLAVVLAATGAVTLLGSCRDSLPPIVVTDGIAGHYILRTIDGFPPPQIVEEGDSVLSITGGVVILAADSTFVDSTDIQWIVSGQAKDTSAVARGFFRLNADGTLITFYSGENAWEMDRDDNTLTQLIEGAVLVYRK